MAVITKFSDKKVLIVDDLPGMRSQLRLSLTSSGFEKLHIVGTIRDALTRMESENYDIILSDYFLGDSTDGQQFLEFLRGKERIQHGTIFVMITAEQSYEKVVTASECAPDDYLIKPFTAQQLNNRLEKLIDRNERFAGVNKARDEKNWARAVAGCDAIIAAKDKYFIEACKIKGGALLKQGRAEDAAELYRSILALRPIAWAKLGLAQSLSQQGDKAQAEQLGRELVSENPQFMAAYDFLSQALVTSGAREEALQVLENARQVSPGTMSRVRATGALAMSVGRHDLAEQVVGQALQKHKYSPVREAQDYAALSKALTRQGKAEEALKVIEEARASFRDGDSSVILAASESVAQKTMGNHARAEALLEQALAGNLNALPAEIATTLADACFALGKEDKAAELLKQVIQNNPDDMETRERVRAAFAAAGQGDQAQSIIDAHVQEIIQLNNDGVRKAQAGELEDAIALLSDAADKLPNNLLVISNAALVLALYLVNHGSEAKKMKACLDYRQQLINKDPHYPKLERIDATLRQIKA